MPSIIFVQRSSHVCSLRTNRIEVASDFFWRQCSSINFNFIYSAVHSAFVSAIPTNPDGLPIFNSYAPTWGILSHQLSIHIESYGFAVISSDYVIPLVNLRYSSASSRPRLIDSIFHHEGKTIYSRNSPKSS